jgi:hypothetical protein
MRSAITGVFVIAVVLVCDFGDVFIVRFKGRDRFNILEKKRLPLFSFLSPSPRLRPRPWRGYFTSFVPLLTLNCRQ